MAQNSAGYFNMQLNWNNSDDTNIPQEDNSKCIPIYRTRKYFFKFVPLNIPLLLGTTNSPVVLNLMNYIRTSDPVVIPGCFVFDGESAFTARTRVVMRVEYRGSKVPDSTGLSNLAGKLRTAELQRQNKKREEIKIEGNNKIEESKVEVSEDEDSGESEFLSEEDEEKPKSTNLPVVVNGDNRHIDSTA